MRLLSCKFGDRVTRRSYLNASFVIGVSYFQGSTIHNTRYNTYKYSTNTNTIIRINNTRYTRLLSYLYSAKNTNTRYTAPREGIQRARPIETRNDDGSDEEENV